MERRQEGGPKIALEAAALRRFTHGARHRRAGTADAGSQVEPALIEILDDEQHTRATGIRISGDYFLVNSHTVLTEWRTPIRRATLHIDAFEYAPMTTVCAYATRNDIALVKAETRSPRWEATYIIAETARLPLPAEAAIMFRSAGGIEIREATVTTAVERTRQPLFDCSGRPRYFSEHCNLHFRGNHGDSGGLVMTEHGAAIGLLAGGPLPGAEPEGSVTVAQAASIIKALDLIDFYAEILAKRAAGARRMPRIGEFVLADDQQIYK